MQRPWVRSHISEAAYQALTRGLAGSELWSLLLDVTEQRAQRRSPKSLQEQWQRDRFVCPAYIDQRTLNALDTHLMAAASEFESIELSPLAPLGSCSAVALASQNKIVSTVRGTEVVSDPTNVLALESARRLRDDPARIVMLATSHRCVRAQEVPKVSGFAAHFRMFCMSTAGHEAKDHGLLVEALSEHIRTHLRILDRLEHHGYRFPERRITLLATPAREPLRQRVAESLGAVPAVFEPLSHDYYDGLRFMISARCPDGAHIPLIDGGTFDWLQKLTSNRKMVFIASAIGSQLAAHLFQSGDHQDSATITAQ